MKLKCCFIICLVFVSAFTHAQLATAKVVGEEANKSKLGYGVFAFYDFPITDNENKSIRIELLDLFYFPPKTDTNTTKGYISIKAGYKYIFSESKTGFYIEPQAGYCRSVYAPPEEPEAIYGDGIALAIEGGYNLEVGERGNAIAFGLKYETDRGASAIIINAVSLRVSYSFGLFKKRQQ